MKEFALAVEDEIIEQEREDKIAALLKEREADITALVEKGVSRVAAEVSIRAEIEVEVDRGKPVEFKIGTRVLKAYKPNETQLIFLLASLGRGQSKTSRMASIVNVMLESLDGDDKDWFEERLLTSVAQDRIHPKTIEGVFEYLTSAWFREDVSEDGAAVPDRG
jgi:hypothetical protein